VNRFTHAAGGMRYDASHQAENTAMLRNFSENSFSNRTPNFRTRGPDENELVGEPAAESQTLMERKMSSQTFTHTSEHRSRLANSALVNFARHISDGLSAFGTRFMNALYESRRRQANQVLRQYRHLIDHSND
jgi:hypothetical protein